MRTFISALILLVTCPVAVAQDDLPREAAEAVRIGKLLYRSEKASWNGTDLFMDRYPEKRSRLGGYMSYAEGAGTVCLFIDRSDQPRSLARITFDSTFSPQAAHVDTSNVPFTAGEATLWAMRSAALQLIREDSLFILYDHTNFNLIPLIDRGKRLVYVLSGPTENGVILLGNDYLIELDKSNRVDARRKLHRNLISIEYEAEEGAEIVGSIHSHVPETGEFITATDICTLMLYSPYAPMKQHYVISSTQVSIWDCERSELVVLTREAWDRINTDQERRGNDR